MDRGIPIEAELGFGFRGKRADFLGQAGFFVEPDQVATLVFGKYDLVVGRVGERPEPIPAKGGLPIGIGINILKELPLSKDS